ncbi:unnamed protein product [Coccothraustes coccothraustes]
MEKKPNDPDVIRTRSLLIWSQTRYRCATSIKPFIYLIGCPKPSSTTVAIRGLHRPRSRSQPASRSLPVFQHTDTRAGAESGAEIITNMSLRVNAAPCRARQPLPGCAAGMCGGTPPRPG